jgi:hypothetical protein
MVAVAISPRPAAGDPPASIQERARGSDRIVVASISDVTASHETNEFGDKLIVSHAKLAVEETMKGPSEPATVDVIGGTLDGYTLHVSSLPLVTRGDRAVFFLERGKNGKLQPHLRGQGILKLDTSNNVRGSSLTLDDIRRMVHER